MVLNEESGHLFSFNTNDQVCPTILPLKNGPSWPRMLLRTAEHWQDLPFNTEITRPWQLCRSIAVLTHCTTWKAWRFLLLLRTPSQLEGWESRSSRKMLPAIKSYFHSQKARINLAFEIPLDSRKGIGVSREPKEDDWVQAWTTLLLRLRSRSSHGGSWASQWWWTAR